MAVPRIVTAEIVMAAAGDSEIESAAAGRVATQLPQIREDR